MIKKHDSKKQSSKGDNIFILLPKLFLILTIVFIMWVIILVSGPLVGVLDPDWTGISASFWLLLISVLIGAFIVIDIVLYASPVLKQEAIASSGKYLEFPEVEHKKGKQVFEFTYPSGSKGGVFSKTYVSIDDGSVVRIRNQMIKKEEIWK